MGGGWCKWSFTSVKLGEGGESLSHAETEADKVLR